MSETLEKPVAETARPMSPISRRFGRNDDAAFNRIMARIDELGLNRNLLELETVGYTVVPVLSEDRIERAKAAILRRVESLTGRKIDPLTATSDDFQGMAYQHYLLYDDPVFQEILLEPKPLALMSSSSGWHKAMTPCSKRTPLIYPAARSSACQLPALC